MASTTTSLQGSCSTFMNVAFEQSTSANGVSAEPSAHALLAEKLVDPLLQTLMERSLKRTFTMFGDEQFLPPPADDAIEKSYMEFKRRDRFGPLVDADSTSEATKMALAESHRPTMALQLYGPHTRSAGPASIYKNLKIPASSSALDSSQLSLATTPSRRPVGQSEGSRALMPKKAVMTIKPVWHAPWKLMRVVSGHDGWVHCIDVEPGNQWMASGSSDRTIKIWDLATSRLKLTLTGHISSVKGLQISTRHPYLFSCGEDKTVKCWDLEQNKVIRHYHGHLNAVNTIAVHPTVDIIATGGRDSTVRIWDIRTKAQILCLTGHTNTIGSVKLQAAEPQVISGSYDSTVRFWDIRTGSTMLTLTNHKKSVRALCLHPRLYMLGSASPDNIKQWKLPRGEFVQNCGGHNAIIEALACNTDGVFVSGGKNGSLHMWDWKSAHCFQKLQSIAQPGSIESEAGIFALTFDHSGSRLLSAEADKTIKIYKENEEATEATHPLQWVPTIMRPTAF